MPQNLIISIVIITCNSWVEASTPNQAEGTLGSCLPHHCGECKRDTNTSILMSFTSGSTELEYDLQTELYRWNTQGRTPQFWLHLWERDSRQSYSGRTSAVACFGSNNFLGLYLNISVSNENYCGFVWMNLSTVFLKVV